MTADRLATITTKIERGEIPSRSDCDWLIREITHAREIEDAARRWRDVRKNPHCGMDEMSSTLGLLVTVLDRPTDA
jgi:hypothetical protein